MEGLIFSFNKLCLSTCCAQAMRMQSCHISAPPSPPVGTRLMALSDWTQDALGCQEVKHQLVLLLFFLWFLKLAILVVYSLKNIKYNLKNNAKISSSGKALSSLFFKRIKKCFWCYQSFTWVQLGNKTCLGKLSKLNKTGFLLCY